MALASPSPSLRPERWFERDQAQLQRTFNPFSIGPRACVGKNLATLELQIIISSLLRRYHFVLENPDMEVSALCLLLASLCSNAQFTSSRLVRASFASR